jgi:hypothetical protein
VIKAEALIAMISEAYRPGGSLKAGPSPTAGSRLRTYGGVARQRMSRRAGKGTAEDRLLDPFDAPTAAAVVSAVTGFHACDEMASRTGIPLAKLDSLLIAGLRGVVRLSQEGGSPSSSLEVP